MTGNMAERLKGCGWTRANSGGSLRKGLASRFHIRLHLGSVQTRCGVNSFLLWYAPHCCPIGSSEGGLVVARAALALLGWGRAFPLGSFCCLREGRAH